MPDKLKNLPMSNDNNSQCIIHSFIKKDLRKCSNYIPNRTPKYSDIKVWKEAYMVHLLHMFSIVENVLRDRYKEFSTIQSNKLFDIFCNIIFDKSSKHITLT